MGCRRRRFAVTAIPLTLTFAFFGMNTRNVDLATSFLSVHDYTWFYGLLLILVVLAATLFAIFWLLGRRYFNLDRAEIAAVLEEETRLARVTRWEDGEGLIIAHRGSSEKFPNRPLDAFQDAVGVGADAIEFDIRRTRDDVLVVYHDEEAAGVRLSDANYRELISRMPPHGLPTLEEVLDAVAGQILVDAELKDSGIEELALSQLLASVDADALLVTSFHAPSVTKLKTLAANVQTGLIVERKDVSPTIETVLAERSRSGADFLVAHKDFVQMGLLDCAREAALPLYLSSVNNADELQTYLRDQHVAGVITDVPDVAIDIRAALDDNRGTDLVIM